MLCNKYYYPGRDIQLKDTIFNDHQIYDQLKKFVLLVKNKYSIPIDNIINEYKTIIIERKYDRFFDKFILNNIIVNIKKNKFLKFEGVKILENLSFYEQLKLFSENKVFIFRHGSSLINLLWIPNNSIIFDIDIIPCRKEIVRRIAKITNSKVFSLDYNNIDYRIFSN